MIKQELVLKQTGEVFDLTSDFVSIGRSPRCSITFENNRVSRNHAYLLRDYDKGFLIFDGDWTTKKPSANGTCVNGLRVSAIAMVTEDDSVYCVKLKNNDLIHIADVATFLYRKYTPTKNTTANGTQA
jgi:pSer/pThr/pTyr-binding forkhead associated (FHA) protein